MVTDTMAGSSPKKPFLVMDDERAGGACFVLLAESLEQVRDRLPGVRVWDAANKPRWLTEEFGHQVGRRRTLDIDEMAPAPSRNVRPRGWPGTP